MEETTGIEGRLTSAVSRPEAVRLVHPPNFVASAESAYFVAQLGSFADPFQAELMIYGRRTGFLADPTTDRAAIAPLAAIDDGGRLHLVWAEGVAERRPGMRATGEDAPLHGLHHSVLSGDGWSLPERIFDGDLTLFPGNRSRLLADSTTGLHLVVSALTSAGPTLKYMRKGTGGWYVRSVNDWESSPVRPSGPLYPSLALNGAGTLHLAFVGAPVDPLDPGRFRGNGNSVFVTRSDDGGSTWSAPTLAYLSGGRLASHVHLAGSGGDELYLAWGRSRPGEVFPTEVLVSSSRDGGRTFGEPTNLSIPVDNGIVHSLRLLPRRAGGVFVLVNAAETLWLVDFAGERASIPARLLPPGRATMRFDATDVEGEKILVAYEHVLGGPTAEGVPEVEIVFGLCPMAN